MGLIYLTAKSRNGNTSYAKPRVVAVNSDNIYPVPNKAGNVRITETRKDGVQNQYDVYEDVAEIEAQVLLDAGQATSIKAKQYILTGQAALGATAAAAFDITKHITEMTSGTAGTADGIQLDAATVGKVRQVYNNTTFALDVWPQTGEKFENLAADAQTTQATGLRKHYVCLVAGTWTIADDYTQL